MVKSIALSLLVLVANGARIVPSNVLGAAGSEAELAETMVSRSWLPGSYCKRAHAEDPTYGADTNVELVLQSDDSLDVSINGESGGSMLELETDAILADTVDPTKTWVAVHGRTCPGKRAQCSGTTVAECKAECAADEGCGGFSWPHGHLKEKSCHKHKLPMANTLFLKQEAPKRAATGTVYIIRHGEKQHDGCLSPTGHERARALVDMFNGEPSDWHETLETPKALFAHQYVTNCERTNQTLQPIAQALNLTVNTEHGGNKDRSPGVGGGNKGAAEAIKQALLEGHDPVLVAWESLNMPYLIKALGTFEFPVYPQGKFDKLYMVELTDGVVTCFHSTWQHWHSNATK